MNKKSVLWYLLEFMVAIIFYTLFFAIAGPNAPASAWIACLFFTLALAATVATPFVFKKIKIRRFLGIPVGYISIGYFLLEFLVGFIFVLMRQKSPGASVTLQLILFVLYCIIVLLLLLVNEYKYPSPVSPDKNNGGKTKKSKDVLVLPEPEEEVTEAEQQETEDEEAVNDAAEEEEAAEETVSDTEADAEEEFCDNGFVDSASKSLKAVLEKCEDKKTHREIERAYDSLRSSIKHSVDSARVQEMAIVNKIALLSKAVDSAEFDSACDTVSEIMTLVEKRNRIIRG